MLSLREVLPVVHFSAVNLQQLFQYFNFKSASSDLQKQVVGLCLDSKTVQVGSVFFAIKGHARDGHDLISEALAKGAIAVVCSDAEKVPKDFEGPILQVQDVRSMASLMAARFYGFPSQRLKTVGVTGTNGKTSVTYLTEYLLNQSGIPTAVMGTIDHHLGEKKWSTDLTTPDPVSLQSRLKDFKNSSAEAVIMEVSSHALDQKRVEGVDFDVAVFTNLTRDHLDYHKTMKQYHEAKQRLFTDLMWKSQKSPTTAVINIDDSFGRRTRVSEKAGIFTYGQVDCDFQFKVQSFDWMGTHFELKTLEGNFELQIPLLGVHNVYNTVAALAVASAFGVKIEQLMPSLQSFKGIPGRLQKVPVDNKQVFIDYAHTPDALEKVLQMLCETRKSIQKKSQIWCVFGCGGDRDAGKRPLMALAAEKYADQVIVTSDNPRTENPRQILEDIEKGFSKTNYKKIENRKEAIHYALTNSAVGDVILIAGKGHEDYQIIGTEKTHFSDYEVVIEGVKP